MKKRVGKVTVASLLIAHGLVSIFWTWLLGYFGLEYFFFVMDDHGSSIGSLFMVAHLWLMDKHPSEYFVMMLATSCYLYWHNSVILGILLVMSREF